MSLIEDYEFELLGVPELPEAGKELRHILMDGGRIVLHCRGGLGRTGTIAARILVEFGLDPRAAIARVRQVRPGAIQTREQEENVQRRGWSSKL